MPGHSIEVVDLGLTIEDAVAMGLEPETYSRESALPAKLELSPLAREWFTGKETKHGKKTVWSGCRRVELNAMTSEQLINYIEAGLRKAGADTKVLPDEFILKVTADHDDTQELLPVLWTMLSMSCLTRML